MIPARPRRTGHVLTTIRLPSELHGRLRDHAHSRGTDMTKLIVEYIERGLGK